MLKKTVQLSIAFAALALLAAYVMQYGFGMDPCRLCYWQRYPYMAVIVVGAIALLNGRHRAGLVLIAALFVTDFGIAAYHAGIELGVFDLPAGCAAGAADTMQDLMSSLGKPPAQCDRPAFVFLNLSLTMWNAIAALTMAFVTIAALRRSN